VASSRMARLWFETFCLAAFQLESAGRRWNGHLEQDIVWTQPIRLPSAHREIVRAFFSNEWEMAAPSHNATWCRASYPEDWPPPGIVAVSVLPTGNPAPKHRRRNRNYGHRRIDGSAYAQQRCAMSQHYARNEDTSPIWHIVGNFETQWCRNRDLY